MWSGSSHSEEQLARIAIRRLGDRPNPRVLIGGLGMGFTARAALDALPALAELVIAEVVPAVVVWNWGPLGHLARHPLRDERVHVELEDVVQVIAQARAGFDAILLDVDNGPQGLTRPANQLLYGEKGLANARRALRPGGIIAIWSASSSPAFERQVRRAGFQADTVRVPEKDLEGTTHTIFLGRLPGGEVASCPPQRVPTKVGVYRGTTRRSAT
jgi:spermidine synthase